MTLTQTTIKQVSTRPLVVQQDVIINYSSSALLRPRADGDDDTLRSRKCRNHVENECNNAKGITVYK
jgi:hypothetical protein